MEKEIICVPGRRDNRRYRSSTTERTEGELVSKTAKSHSFSLGTATWRRTEEEGGVSGRVSSGPTGHLIPP